jgi:hypothetical protein
METSPRQVIAGSGLKYGFSSILTGECWTRRLAELIGLMPSLRSIWAFFFECASVRGGGGIGPAGLDHAPAWIELDDGPWHERQPTAAPRCAILWVGKGKG